MEKLPTNFEQIFLDAGFPTVGIVDFDLALPLYKEHASRYQDWVNKGAHGEMQYLQRGLERRLNPKLVFPEVKSVLAVLMPYDATPVGSAEIRYARYLNGPDYHDTLASKLQVAMKNLSLEIPNLNYKICVDTSAVLERSWAMLTGLGWIGKNTLLIHPQLGSYVFIGVVFLNKKFGSTPKLLKDYCGNCTRCISGCPTNAIKEAHYLDSRDCISYLTLEKRGEWQTVPNLKGFVAGCDICQEVCPFNSKAARAVSDVIRPSEYLILDAEKLRSETEAEYKLRVQGTALSRIKYADFKRNLGAI